MVYNLSYRRPAHQSFSGTSFTSTEKQRSIDDSCTTGSCLAGGIPDALSFDRIVSGGTCPPCTLRDFMNYLKYIEHDAENLQFFLWARGYIKRFNELPESEQKLSPEWKQSSNESDVPANNSQYGKKLNISPETEDALRGTGLGSARLTDQLDEKANGNGSGSVHGNPFHTPPRSPSQDTRDTASQVAPSFVSGSNGSNSHDFSKSSSAWQSNSNVGTAASNSIEARRKAGTAFEDAGLKWQPFTIQPYRDELARIVSVYIADGAHRQLNISAKERNNLLHALENTTHPSAFTDILRSVEWSLRCQAHPNFIRWTICNGNRPRVIFARGLGVGGILLGIVAGIIITLSGAGRAWRVFTLILFFIGIATLIAAWKGMCVVLHGMHHRHVRPWELFQDEDDKTVELKDGSYSGSYDTLESSISSNSWEDEPWVAKYEKRNVVRKVFDREVWVQEPALRQIQDTIFLQAVLGGLLGGGILTAIFVAVPTGNFF